MNREEVERKSLKLLETEEEIIRCQNTERKKLPDLEAAKKRIASAKAQPMKGIIMILIAVAWFLWVRPNLDSFTTSNFLLGMVIALPLLCVKLLQWPLMLVLICYGVLALRVKPASSDRNAENVYRQRQHYNEELEKKEAALREAQRKQAEELNRLAGTEYGGASPKCFFQIPFDSRKDFRTIKDGMEFYTSDDFGNTVCAGPPFLHDPKLPGLYQGYMRFDGFYSSSKGCKPREACMVLETSGTVTIYKDEAYLKAHPNETCWLSCVYDTLSIPTANRAYFKMEPTKLENWTKVLATAWDWSMSWPQRFLASGLAAYEPHLREKGSSVPDHRDEYEAKNAEKLKYDDLGAIQEGRDRGDSLVIFNSYTCSLLEKGYRLMDNSKKRTLLLVLTDQSVCIPEIAYNRSSHEYESWSGFHGWIASVGIKKRKSSGTARKKDESYTPAATISEAWCGKPGKASTMDFMTRYLKSEFAFFDPLAKRPDGLTDEQFRYWMNCWYRAYVRQHKPAEAAK